MTPTKLKKALEAAGLSQSQAARELGISRRMLMYYLSGEWPIPKLVELGVQTITRPSLGKR